MEEWKDKGKDSKLLTPEGLEESFHGSQFKTNYTLKFLEIEKKNHVIFKSF